MAHPNQHSELIEQRFIPADLDDLTELRTRMHHAGVAPATAKSVCGWLLELAAGEDYTSSPNARSGYRRVLAQLEDLDSDPQRYALSAA